jgi:hypothetical protein
MADLSVSERYPSGLRSVIIPTKSLDRQVSGPVAFECRDSKRILDVIRRRGYPTTEARNA